MDPKTRNGVALRKRVDELVDSISEHYQTALANAREEESSDYSRTAQKELSIKEDALAIVTAAQNLSTLIRELQELWLFGSLDTLADAKDGAADREKASEVAELIERLAKMPPQAYTDMPNGKARRNGETGK